MTIRKAIFSLSLALPLALAGCPTEDGEGTDIVTCSVNADCLADSEICHPIGKICVPTCTEAADCPENQNACEAIKDANGNALTTELVCQCKTGSEFCTSEDTTVELVCSQIDNVCETKCVSNDDCSVFSPARECSNGVCVPAAVCSGNASCTDASASKCGGDGKCAACVADEDCSHIAGGKTDCDNGVCVVPACNTANAVPGSAGGPDICAYGETCTAGACVDVPAATCAGATSVTWDQAKQGPVLTSISTVFSATSLSNECADLGTKLEATVTFYAPKGLTYSSTAALLHQWTANTPGQIVFVKPNGSTTGAAFVRGMPASGAKSGTFVIGSCGVTQSTLTEGRAVYIKDSAGNAGNAICL